MHGLGNQMFQYAFGRSLEQRSGQPVKYHLGWYEKSKAWRDAKGQSEGCVIRDYTLQVFPNIHLEMLDARRVMRETVEHLQDEHIEQDRLLQ